LSWARAPAADSHTTKAAAAITVIHFHRNMVLSF
jgi:hypothetical protein